MAIDCNTVEIVRQYAANPSKADVLSELRHRAKLLIESETRHKGLYVSLCEWIREKQIEPAKLTEELQRVGMHKVTISQLKTVCYTSQEIFDLWKNSIIGFKAALRKARGKEKSIETQWLKAFAAVERLLQNGDPPKPLYVSNGCLVLCTREREINQPKTVKSEGWIVTIKKQNKGSTDETKRTVGPSPKG